jgi:hypothetical protein
MLSMSRWCLSLLVLVAACTFLATSVHAQTQPGATNGGLTTTLPTTGGGATIPALAGTHAGPTAPVSWSAWLQGFSIPVWPKQFMREALVRKQVRARRAVGTH